MTRRPFVLVFLALALTTVACSGDNKVGNESLLNVKDQVNPKLGATTSTTAPPVTSTTIASLGVGRPTTTIATATTVKQEFVITINGDKSGKPQFDPNTGQVFVNYPVRWQNNDTKVRSVVFDDGSKRSPDLQPGQSWTTTFAVAKQYNYTDGTRPFAVASITVLAR